jgi:hypothetical protein
MNSTSLVRKHSNNQELYLESGKISFPFSIVLPSQLPTSYEHLYGKVRYSIQATIDMPW